MTHQTPTLKAIACSLIREHATVTLPPIAPYVVKALDNRHYRFNGYPTQVVYFDHIESAYAPDFPIKPDAIGWSDDTAILVSFLTKDSPAIDESKLANIDACELAILQIDIRECSTADDPDFLCELILHKCPRQWLYEPIRSRETARIDALVSQINTKITNAQRLHQKLLEIEERRIADQQKQLAVRQDRDRERDKRAYDSTYQKNAINRAKLANDFNEPLPYNLRTVKVRVVLYQAVPDEIPSSHTAPSILTAAQSAHFQSLGYHDKLDYYEAILHEQMRKSGMQPFKRIIDAN